METGNEKSLRHLDSQNSSVIKSINKLTPANHLVVSSMVCHYLINGKKTILTT